MKNLRVAIEDERHADLLAIQKYYSDLQGVKLSQAQVIKMLLFNSANAIKNTGKLEYKE